MRRDSLSAFLHSMLAYSPRTTIMIVICAGLVTETSLNDAQAGGIKEVTGMGNRHIILINDLPDIDQRPSGTAVDGEEMMAIPALRQSQGQNSAEKVVHEASRNPLGPFLRKIALEKSLTDAEIQQHVTTLFALDPFLEEHEIGVSVDNQHVTLSGAVDYEYEKSRAEELTSHVNGVAEVTNDLVVLSEWTWESDVEIQGRIITQLRWSPFVNSHRIHVTVEQGAATLTGVVGSWTEREIAEKNAYEGGAKNVVNKLKLRALVGG